MISNLIRTADITSMRICGACLVILVALVAWVKL
jgi:hypothetical protein